MHAREYDPSQRESPRLSVQGPVAEKVISGGWLSGLVQTVNDGHARGERRQPSQDHDHLRHRSF